MTRRDNDLLSACVIGWLGFLLTLGILLAHVMGWI